MPTGLIPGADGILAADLSIESLGDEFTAA
jgi:hypothetical protein